jgi:O-methyltransferase
VKTFEEYYAGCDNFCSIGIDKARTAFEIIKGCPIGDFAEVGVYRGGFTMFLGNIAADLGVKVYGFDTFRGTPFQGPDDKHAVGDFVHEHSSFDSVSSRVNESVVLVRGIFTRDIKCHDRKYAFVHLDGDQYQTTIDGLEFFYSKLLSGGCILLDDYDWHACPGVEKALVEFGVKFSMPSMYQALLRNELR